MEKFDNRDKMPGHASYESNSRIFFPGKGDFRNRKSPKSVPYISDPLLIPRINQYLAENKDKVYIDINDMVNELQSRYREYGRRKRHIFRESVQKAFTAVLQQCGLNENSMECGDEYVGSTDNSSEVEECNSGNEETSKTSNHQMINLYKPAQNQMGSKNVQKSSAKNAELIDLSSDDENVKKKDGDEKAVSNRKSSELRNHSNNSQEPLALANHKNSNKAAKSEKVIPSSRKRKLALHSDRIIPQASRQKKPPMLQEPKVTFADFGGNTKALEEVCKLILHVRHPELYKQIGLTSPRGFLLHGPPGCGKTLLANAIAGELDVPFLKVSAPELVGGVSGESEERIRELFSTAVECAPCVLFIDEVDVVMSNRQNAQREMERRIVAQLLTCLDELNNVPNGDQVLVIGATNRPDGLDPAIRRAGRFDREVCLGIPDLKGREQILRVMCKNLKMSPNFSYEEVAENTPGFVGADLLALTREAAMAAINRVFGAIHTQNKSRGMLHGKKMKLDPDKSPKMVEQGEKEMSGETPASLEQNPSTTSGLESDAGEKDGTSLKEGCHTEKSGQKPHDERSNEARDVDMDVTETVAEKSANGEVKNAESKDGSIKEIDSEDEREVDLFENCESTAVNLETLMSWLKETPPLTNNQLKNVYLAQSDFKLALECVQPSAKREGFATVPDVTWDDIGSLADVREELKLSILGPVKLRKQFEQLGLSAPAGILICGPPGCGKTLLAKAVANEAGINFISVKGPELLNMYVGESERAVRQCFQRARNSSPCVIFFDELDALCPKRSGSGENGASMRVVNQMLTEMDGVEARKEVYIMAATNRPDIVDPAVLRPGRLDKVLYVGLPKADDRADILRALTKNGTRPKLGSDVNLTDIAKRQECEGYSGADLAALVREAGVQALKDLIRNTEMGGQSDTVVCSEHFERALRIVRPSVSYKDRVHYESFKKEYCSSN